MFIVLFDRRGHAVARLEPVGSNGVYEVWLCANRTSGKRTERDGYLGRKAPLQGAFDFIATQFGVQFFTG